MIVKGMTLCIATAADPDIDWIRYQLDRLVAGRMCEGALTRYEAERCERLGDLEATMLRELGSDRQVAKVNG